MVRINEVNIISIDKTDDSWEVEGEILFEEDLSCGFAVTYVPDDDELENLQLEFDSEAIGKFDKSKLKELIIAAANEFDD